MEANHGAWFLDVSRSNGIEPDRAFADNELNYLLSQVDEHYTKQDFEMLLEFTSVNSEISQHAWRFDTTALRSLRSLGLQFADTTLETVLTCQNRFVERSARIQAYLSKHEQLFAARPWTMEVGAA